MGERERRRGREGEGEKGEIHEYVVVTDTVTCFVFSDQLELWVECVLMYRVYRL